MLMVSQGNTSGMHNYPRPENQVPAQVQIKRFIKPRQQQYGEGINAGVDAIIAALSGEFQAEPKQSEMSDAEALAMVGIMFLIFIAFIAFIVWRIRKKGTWYTHSGGPNSRNARGGGFVADRQTKPDARRRCFDPVTRSRKDTDSARKMPDLAPFAAAKRGDNEPARTESGQTPSTSRSQV